MGTIATLAAPPASSARGDGDRSDEELVAAIRRGDDRAFEVLWQRWHRRIAAYVNGMVNDHARAEDITQDVFVSALRRMRATDAPIAFKPWIYEIAKNACIDAFRRARRTEEVSYDADGGDPLRLVSHAPTPDVAVDHRMSLDTLRGAFGGLSPTHHDILVMRELEGLSYREIGERLGMSRPSVESTLFRARRRLSEEYEELVSGERCRRVQGLIVNATATASSLGARESRRMAKHVSHCTGCRRQAALAGIDVATLAPRPLREKVAALLPIPAFLKRRWFGDEGAAAVAAGQAPAAHLAATVVSQYAEPAALTGWARAAAAAATLAFAGVGAGAATDADRMFGGRDEQVPAVEAAAAASAAPAATASPAAAPARGTSGRTRTSPPAATARDRASSSTRSGAGGTSSAQGSSAPSAGAGAPAAPAAVPQVDLAGAGDPAPATGAARPAPPAAVLPPAAPTKVTTAPALPAPAEPAAGTAGQTGGAVTGAAAAAVQGPTEAVEQATAGAAAAPAPSGTTGVLGGG